jgi:hypothetical protein
MTSRYYEVLGMGQGKPYLMAVGEDERLEGYDVYYLVGDDRVVAERLCEYVSDGLVEWKEIAPIFDEWRIPEEEVDDWNKNIREEAADLVDKVADYYRRSL